VLQRLLVKWVIGSNLYQAAQAGDVAKVRALLAVDPRLATRPDKKHPLNPLHLAAMQPNIALAEVLLTYGVDINILDLITGRTPLHLAAQLGHHQMVRYLLSHGANMHVCDAHGLTPLHLAQQAQKRAVIHLMTQYIEAEQPSQ
jgi:ankyrin repeat protein